MNRPIDNSPPTRLMLATCETFLDLAALQYMAHIEVNHYWTAMVEGGGWAELAGEYLCVERIN